MRRLAFAVACGVAASWSMAGEAAARDYSGKYKSKITLPNGDVVKANVTIVKVDGSIYRSESKYGDFIELSMCFAEEDRLSCGFAPKSGGGYVGFSIYEPDGSGKLIGKFAETSTQKLGKEVLTPVGK
ncbi:hypothetical protein [Chenggangzhangella methanolivorans]|uniref:Uncharacterized protein n=1 Tax=Chenggangzhangella methanolivorans TaxID=1437009 RepID=A0A9E6R7U9_9HYPH|nr:hypothetical protein [Chenggangzhangella methanolivorans]QZN99439.1 hypothetical protein K6K41_22300 [Chenggangzhangella methanolivorans]